jgi:hypothetical protein
MDNRRAKPRQRVLKSGIISFGGSVIDCVVRNISETGASLQIASPVGIPKDFILIVRKESLKRPCRVAWRKADRIGVQFA